MAHLELAESPESKELVARAAADAKLAKAHTDADEMIRLNKWQVESNVSVAGVHRGVEGYKDKIGQGDR